jgi:2-polyprenyl-6-methoxyphenol hydroxylase-like FAD-dependent oxidoreductase
VELKVADVIVVGGAVAGTALANALGTRGVRTLVLEKVSREIHSTRGDLLHPPTLKLLDRLGVLDALHADGALPITEMAVSDRTGMIARFSVPGADDTSAGRTIALPHDRIEAVMFRCAERFACVQSDRGTVTGLLREGDRVVGVLFQAHGSSDVHALRADVVAGCDGAQSRVRRDLDIACEEHPYDHEQVIIGGTGETELPAGLHWYLDDLGALCVVSRPRGAFRILLTFQLGRRGDLLKLPDPALHEHVSGRFPALAGLRFGKADAHVYRLGRHVAARLYSAGAALVGDAAHATHPAGATGMSLAVTGADRLAGLLAPALAKGSPGAVDTALAAYDAERRPAAIAAIASNHEQALRLWQSDLFRDPKAYARAVDPNGNWGAGGASWGQDPAAIRAAPSDN